MARHLARKNGRGIRFISSVAVVATVVGMAPTPNQILEAQADVRRTMSADYSLLGVHQFQVPGTGSTINNPPTEMPDMSYLDSGVWNRIPDGYALLDKRLYPATLEQSGPNSGENSVSRGADALVAEILKKDRRTTVIGGAGGSQGALVWAEALERLAAMGYPMDNVFVVLYSDPGMPGTGILSRYTPSEKVLTTGLHGGATELPTEGKFVRVVNAGDPMAFFPKDPWNLVAVLNAVAGFVLEHGALKDVDYQNATVTTEGNVTTVVARPYGDVVSLVAPLVMLNMPPQLVRFVNELIEPLVLAGGMYETGHIQQNPSLESVFKQIVAIATGIRNAIEYAVRVATGQPTPVVRKGPTGPGLPGSPVEDLIDDMYDRDEELNGSPAPADDESSNSFASQASQSEEDITPTPSLEETPAPGPAPQSQQRQEMNQAPVVTDPPKKEELDDYKEPEVIRDDENNDDSINSDDTTALNKDEEEKEETKRSLVDDKEDDKKLEKSDDEPSALNRTSSPSEPKKDDKEEKNDDKGDAPKPNNSDKPSDAGE